MKRTVKKITAVAICCVLAVSSAFVANAKWIGDERDFRLIGETRKISNNQVLVTATGYNESNPKYYGVMFENMAGKGYSVYFKDCVNKLKFLNLPKNQEFYYNKLINLGGSYFTNIYDIYTFDNTGGEYEKVKIKLSTFSPYFNEDGSVTQTLDDGSTHTFAWSHKDYDSASSDKNDYCETSGMCVKSGAAVTAVVPDKDGYAELYISKKIGVRTELSMYLNYRRKDGLSLNRAVQGARLYGLVRGDITKDDSITIADATLLQKYVVGAVDFDDLQLFNSDVNHDGQINIVDSTLIQKYIVGLDS